MTSKGARPPVVGIDLGGTKILAGVVSHDHQILGRAKRTTPAQEGGRAIVEAIVACAEEALETAGMNRTQIGAVGIGSPGPLDVATGVILFSANLNVKNFPIGPEVSGFFDRPVLVQNDVRAGGYAELRLGAGRGYQNIIFAFVGTGIGGCLVQGGEIVTGATGNAGELGHMILKAGGPPCGCGARGCMEALASKTAIARRVEKAIRKGLPTMLGERMARRGGRLKSRDLAEAVITKDLVALKEVQRAAHFLGLGLGNLINVFGPEIVIVGGGVAGALGDSYLDLVRTAARSHILTDPAGTIRIERAGLGDNAGILGAALLARERLLES
ncbi:MAG: ROK family protein [Isosphaeraceae bacterium]